VYLFAKRTYNADRDPDGTAPSTLGVSIEIVTATDNREIDDAFASLAQKTH
jgi:hypothetical protein